MTMAAACKQGIILGRLWAALLLSLSKRPKKAKKLTKRPKMPKKKKNRKLATPPVFGKTAFHLGAIDFPSEGGILCALLARRVSTQAIALGLLFAIEL